MENDEKTIPDEKQETTPSVDETNTDENVREDDKTPLDEGDVPRWRVKEITDEKNVANENLSTLQDKYDALKQQQNPVEEDEPTTWKEIQDRAVRESKRAVVEEMKKTSEAEALQDKAIDKSFEHLKSLGNIITPDVRNQVLEQMIKTGNKDVIGNYLSIKEQVDKSVKAQETKQAGNIPSSDKGTDVERPAINYKDIAGKTAVEIAREAGQA